jgi:regulator of protease activity HflC (stomatin/prohibitin superfamily)
MAAIPRKRGERVAAVGLALTVIGVLVMWAVAHYSASAAARVELFHYLAAAIIWAVSILHLRTRRLAAEERQAIEESERLRAEEGRAQLFDEDAIGSTMAQSRLREMERYGAPIASVVVILLQLLTGAAHLYALALSSAAPNVAQAWGVPAGQEVGRTALAAGLSFILAFLAFGLGKYAAGSARDARLSLLRAGGGYTIGCAITSMLLTLSYLFAYSGMLTMERALAWAIPGLLVLLALEMAVNFVLDFYRPRTRGEEPRPVYDSRLTGLLAEPQGLFKTFAHTLDYQFGFRVSETWFFHFLNRAIAPLVLFQLAALYLLTCIVIIQPGEVGILERWGRPLGVDELPPAPLLSDDPATRAAKEAKWDALPPPLEPGFYLKLPWPIDEVRRVNRDLVQVIELGSPQDGRETDRPPPGKGPQVVSWAEEHQKDEYNYLMPLTADVAEVEVVEEEEDAEARLPAELLDDESDAAEERELPDAMFIAGMISVQYVVGRPHPERPAAVHPGDAYRALYRYDDRQELMVALAESEITSYMGGSDFWDVLVEDASRVERELQERIQAAADRAGTGVRIIYLSLSNMHPPVGEVGKAYQEVISSREEMQATIHAAQAEAIQRHYQAQGDAAALVLSAEAYREERELLAQAAAQRFAKQLYAYNQAPEVFLYRDRMRNLEAAFEQVQRLTVVPPGVKAFLDAKQDLTASAVGKALGEELATE